MIVIDVEIAARCIMEVFRRRMLRKMPMYLGVTATDFAEQYLGGKDSEGNYQTKHKPCDFLIEDGSCKLGDCKPESCKKYPYTNQPGRLWSLYSVLKSLLF